MNTSSENIKTFALVMLITVSIDSIRNLPATAIFGSHLIFYLLLSAFTFLIPVALVSAELSASFKGKGGIYFWVKKAFGEDWGFIAIWLQWINTVVWYPTILSFIAATSSYLISPSLANDRVFLVSVILITFWVLTLINLKGLKTSAHFASFCAIFGMLIPMGLIIALGLIWFFSGHLSQINLSPNHWLPDSHINQSWISLTAIITAFLGIELSSVHINHIHKPQTTYPLSVLISAVIIIVTMLLGSLAIAIVIPEKQISLVSGVIEAFQSYFKQFHMQQWMPLIIIMILLGSLGSIINWIISPAKGLLQASDDGYLPRFFDQVNKHDVPTIILISQAVLVSFICLAFLLMPSVNGSYWLLTDLSTQLYVMMYVLMFMAAIAIKKKHPHLSNAFNIPGGPWGMYLTSFIGLISCMIALIVGFFPPADINVGSPLHYESIFFLGILMMIMPAFLFIRYKHRLKR